MPPSTTEFGPRGGERGYKGEWWTGNRKVAEEVTETQAAFIEWLVDPNRQGTQAEWAAARGHVPKTVSTWKKDPRFRAAWDARLRSLNIEPDRIQGVIDAVYAKALEGDTKAASLYLQYIERFTPKSVNVIEDRSARDMSDEELEAEFLADVKHLRASGE